MLPSGGRIRASAPQPSPSKDYFVNPVESALSPAFDRLEAKWKNAQHRIGP